VGRSPPAGLDISADRLRAEEAQSLSPGQDVFLPEQQRREFISGAGNPAGRQRSGEGGRRHRGHT